MKYKLLPLLLLLALASGRAEWNLPDGDSEALIEGYDAAASEESELLYEGGLKDRKKIQKADRDEEKEEAKKKTMIKKKEHKDDDDRTMFLRRALQDETTVQLQDETKDRKRDRINKDDPTQKAATPTQKKRTWFRKKEQHGKDRILSDIFDI